MKGLKQKKNLIDDPTEQCMDTLTAKLAQPKNVNEKSKELI